MNGDVAVVKPQSKLSPWVMSFPTATDKELFEVSSHISIYVGLPSDL
jgi:hypothetical protein